MFQRALAAQRALGQPAPESWHQRALALAVDGRLVAQSATLGRELIVNYPNPSNWRDALLALRVGEPARPAGTAAAPPADPAFDLDIRRLARAADALAGERDYLEFAQALSRASLPGEAKAVLDEGVSRDMLDPSEAVVRAQLTAVTAGAARERAGLAGAAHPRPGRRRRGDDRRRRRALRQRPISARRRALSGRAWPGARRIRRWSTRGSARRWRAAATAPGPKRRCGSSPGRAPVWRLLAGLDRAPAGLTLVRRAPSTGRITGAGRAQQETSMTLYRPAMFGLLAAVAVPLRRKAAISSRLAAARAPRGERRRNKRSSSSSRRHRSGCRARKPPRSGRCSRPSRRRTGRRPPPRFRPPRRPRSSRRRASRSRRLQFQIGAGTQNQALQSQAVDAMLASGGAPATAMPTLLGARANYAIQASDWATADQMLTRYLEVDPSNVERLRQAAEVKINLQRNGDALAIYQRILQVQDAANQQPTQEVLRRTLALATDQRNAQLVQQLTQRLLERLSLRRELAERTCAAAQCGRSGCGAGARCQAPDACRGRVAPRWRLCRFRGSSQPRRPARRSEGAA